MNKINFVNNSEPALSAENLNQMQNNMEEVGVAVSSTEPTTNEKVWIQKGKNLLDLSKCDFANCILNDDGTITSQINDSYYCFVFTTSLNDFLLDNKGKTITLSTGTPLNNKITSIIINGIRTNGENYQEAGEDSTGNASIIIAEDFTSITSLEVRFNRQYEQITDYTTKINYLQLELGEATEYQAYIDEKVWVRNSNGVFIPFVPENKPIYITTDVECATNEYIDGKQVYRKRINCGNLPNATILKVPTGLSNVFYERIEGIITNYAGSYKPLPIVENDSSSSYNTSLMVYNNEIWISTDNNQSANYAWVDLYYTKNS